MKSRPWKSPPKPETRCCRRSCGMAYSEHVNGFCLGTAGKTFKRSAYYLVKRTFPQYPAPRARCGRRRCGRLLSSHVGERCPFNPALKFLIRKPRGSGHALGANLYVNDRQIDALADVLTMLQRNGDPRVVAGMYRSELTRLLVGVVRAQKRMERKRSAAVLSPSLAAPAA